ncbi:hypothetical protein [Rhizobacter sp. SG703]|uniref:hypothetical protein n=1 Tax=Rhizobacter sp. SG703 TaxID=2587140 RepID=UPI0014488A91|nr:hypothetical protein [Rhizobacter sp. SG703]NKI97822.1 hypothetical protein [Rhizobacter sp. SG703]
MSRPFALPLSCLALLLGALIGSPAEAQAVEAVVVNDYDVFVDPPTAFAFIKLPTGWKFIGKLDAAQLRQLPPGTLTSLLPADEEATRVAAGSKPAVAKRKG